MGCEITYCSRSDLILVNSLDSPAVMLKIDDSGHRNFEGGFKILPPANKNGGEQQYGGFVELPQTRDGKYRMICEVVGSGKGPFKFAAGAAETPKTTGE